MMQLRPPLSILQIGVGYQFHDDHLCLVGSPICSVFTLACTFCQKLTIKADSCDPQILPTISLLCVTQGLPVLISNLMFEPTTCLSRYQFCFSKRWSHWTGWTMQNFSQEKEYGWNRVTRWKIPTSYMCFTDLPPPANKESSAA